MKKNEIIELNGTEYTLELNRDSFIQIDHICNVSKCWKIINEKLYDYIDEIDDNYNPFESTPKEEELDEKIKEKEMAINKLSERAFYIWLYPNHKLTITQVKEILKPYLEDLEKSEWLGEKLGEYLHKCIAIKEEYNQQRKNLEAQINK